MDDDLFKKNSDSLIFKARNNFTPKIKENVHYGIGIENVKRRLDLLFGKNYKLKTNIFEENFTVTLKIPA